LWGGKREEPGAGGREGAWAGATHDQEGEKKRWEKGLTMFGKGGGGREKKRAISLPF